MSYNFFCDSYVPVANAVLEKLAALSVMFFCRSLATSIKLAVPICCLTTDLIYNKVEVPYIAMSIGILCFLT